MNHNIKICTKHDQELDSDGMAMVKRIPIRSDKPDDLAEGLENTPIGGHKGWWNSFLGAEEKLDDLKFGNKMVLLMDILKESALIGDKVKPKWLRFFD